MQGFQKTVLIVAAVMLVISLVVLSGLIKSAVVDVEWPPQVATCPDYWTGDGKGKCASLKGSPDNTGTSSGQINVASKAFATPQQRCDWARGHNVTWDGITDAAFCDNA